MKTRTALIVQVGPMFTTIAAPPSTIAKPSRAWTGSLRFPSRYAATKPARKTLAVKVTRRPSTNDSVAARTQTAVGAPKLKRRRPSNRSGTAASAGSGEPGRCLRRLWRIAPERDLDGALDRSDHDQDVERIRPCEGPDPAHGANVLQEPRARLRPR